MTRKIIALTILLLATACVPPIVATPPQEPIKIGFYSVTPQIEWNRSMMSTRESWTIDGYALQALRFYTVGDGQTLSGQTDPDGKSPAFHKSMLPNEIQEFFVETLAAGGWAKVKPSGLKPAKFGSLPGFRFSFTMVEKDGLEYEGMALGAVKDDELNLILYSGTKLHYFPKYKPAVEKVFASISM
ncbi:MAG: hypothetical protein OEZ03_05020 [Alphaproteobacteria bacterium]|nr:hypothetical protein [Alphaproteobacteria bacterium]